MRLCIQFAAIYESQTLDWDKLLSMIGWLPAYEEEIVSKKDQTPSAILRSKAAQDKFVSNGENF